MTDYNSNHTGIEIDNAVHSVAKKLDNSIAIFVPQQSPPVHGEGKVFYDNDSHSLSVFSDIPNITLNLGQESYIRVVNNSGATILNGSACRHNGASSGLPSVVLAQANTFDNAMVLGICTHDIPDDAEGFLTIYGIVGELNTGTHPEGAILYLSDTVPGAFTTVLPHIVTKIGSVVVSDVLNGKMLVRIESNKALPSVIGFLNGGAVPVTINATPQNIVNYVTSGEHLTDVDPVAGIIHIITEGIYRVSATVNIQHDDTANNLGVATLHVYSVDDNVDILTMTFGVAKNQTSTNLSMNIPFNSIADENFILKISSTTNLTNITTNAVSFDIKSEYLR